MDKLWQVTSVVVNLLRQNPGLTESDANRMENLVKKVLNVLQVQEIAPANLPLLGAEMCSMGINMKRLLACIEVLLVKLNDNVTEAEKVENKFVLTAEETENLSFLLQFFTRFGIVTCLERGVGRVDSAPKFDAFSSFTPREKYKMLCCYSCRIYSLCVGSTTTRNLVVQTLLTDLLAAMMQICFSPKSVRILDKAERQECMRQLNDIVGFWISKDRLTEEIFLLQGNMTKHVSPKWLQHKCGVMLSRILLEENGMMAVITTIVRNLNGDEPGNSEGWEQVVALSSILSTLPATGISPEKYCEIACPQLLELLVQAREKKSESSRRVVRVTVTTLHALHEKYPDESSVFEKLICEPLSLCCADSSTLVGTRSLSTLQEQDFSNCIENLHQICVSVGVPPSSLLSMLLVPYLKIIFTLMCDIKETSSHLTSLSKDILKTLLKSVGHNDAASLIILTFGELHRNTPQEIGPKTPLEGLKFSINANGVVCPVIRSIFDPTEILLKQDTKVQLLIDILNDSELGGLVGDVFLLLLKNLCDPLKNMPSQVNEDSLLAQEDRAAEALRANEERFITFGLVSSLCECVNPNILLSDTSQMLHFIKAMLENLMTKMNDPQSAESVKMCISVLGMCLMSDLSSCQKAEMNSIVPVLQEIASGELLDSATKELLSDLIVAIRTFGAVNETSLHTFSKAMKEQLRKFEGLQQTHDMTEKNTTREASNAKEEIPNKEETLNITQEKIGVLTSKTGSDLETSYNEALEEVFDPSPALKGGSLRYLTKCIRQKFPLAIQNIEKIVEIFLENLEHKDSFVFLSAVQGLAVIATNYSRHIASENLLEKIIEKYFASETQQSEALCCEIEIRLKLGEVITRVIKAMGDMGPHHASILLPEFLKAMKHPSPDMRASCMSNFAELAPMAPYYLTQIQHEIRDCLCGAAKSDPDLLVRRAAVFAIQRIISELGEEVINILSDVIRDLYHSLKDLYQNDTDNSAQLHAQLALQELDKIMRRSIFKPPSLSKKITILPT